MCQGLQQKKELANGLIMLDQKYRVEQFNPPKIDYSAEIERIEQEDKISFLCLGIATAGLIGLLIWAYLSDREMEYQLSHSNSPIYHHQK